jgi:predicted nucleic acid-binding protein
MYLLDTNIWLERLLEQQQSEVVRQLLEQIAPEQLCISDFALHSIALALTRRQRQEAWLRFVQDILIDGDVTLIRLQPQDLQAVVESMEQQNLDYDDAYQYTIAKKYNLTLVSFDSDFDLTERGRQTPSQVLLSLASDA